MQDLFFFPEEFKIDPAYRVRLWQGDEDDQKHDRLRIRALARQIEAVGQIDSGVVLPGGPPYTLIIGHRRRAAIAYINNHRALQELPVLGKLRVRIEPAMDPLQQAAISNLDTFSPMEIAALVFGLRRKFNWLGKEGTVKIAAFLAVDQDYVLRYEKLLQADPPTQRALHRGKLPFDAATGLIEAYVTRREAVLGMAQRINENKVDATSKMAVATALREMGLGKKHMPKKHRKRRSDRGISRGKRKARVESGVAL